MMTKYNSHQRLYAVGVRFPDGTLKCLVDNKETLSTKYCRVFKRWNYEPNEKQKIVNRNSLKRQLDSAVKQVQQQYPNCTVFIIRLHAKSSPIIPLLYAPTPIGTTRIQYKMKE